MSFWNCKGNDHNCGRVEYPRNLIGPRCVAYSSANGAHAFHKNSTNTTPLRWSESLTELSESASVEAGQEQDKDRPTSHYALPRECISPRLLLTRPDLDSHRYIAVSYVWDQTTSWIQWNGRRTTEQALGLAERLAKSTSLPLWIDAICIPQDDEPIKMQELAKMADIYRGAVAVVCLVPEVTAEVCEVVVTSNSIMEADVYAALESGGDVYGSFMFATSGNSPLLGDLFSGRWWERAWTFQEALLNPRTFLVGEREETIPIQDVLRIVEPVRRYAAPRVVAQTLGRPVSFWDSLSKMSNSAEEGNRRLSLGDAMSCVWRRNATVPHDMVYSLLGVCELSTQVQPEYRRPIGDVLLQLFESASLNGDYSWIVWCHERTQDEGEGEDGLCMVPTPENVRAAPFMGIITKWEFFPPSELNAQSGSERGVLVPFKSTGVIRWESPSCNLTEMVRTLKEERGHSEGEIWDLLFGMRVGICRDINRAVGSNETSDISVPLLNSAVAMIGGEMAITEAILDLKGEKTETPNLGFINYAAMAARTWRKDRQLVAMSSQGGTIVVPENKATGPARIHVLAAGCARTTSDRAPSHGVRLAFVAHDSARFHASATGVMVEKENSGSGSWQLRRIGSRFC